MPDDALGRPYQVPVKRAPLLPNGVMGMLIFVATEVMFFSGLISAFVIGKSNAIGGWPPKWWLGSVSVTSSPGEPSSWMGVPTTVAILAYWPCCTTPVARSHIAAISCLSCTPEETVA